jgi:DNA-directed RNA polymerase specialized sigma24 family protein
VVDAPNDPGIRTALAGLPPAQRAAVVLRFYLDLSIDDTAQVLGKRPGTVRALTSQGVARLREDLGATWLEVHDE